MGKDEIVRNVGAGGTTRSATGPIITAAAAVAAVVGWPVLAAVATVAGVGYLAKKSSEKD